MLERDVDNLKRRGQGGQNSGQGGFGGGQNGGQGGFGGGGRDTTNNNQGN